MKKIISVICFLFIVSPFLLLAEAQYDEFIDKKVIVIDNEGQIYKGILEKEMTTKIVLVGYGNDARRQFVDLQDIQELKMDSEQNAKSAVNNVLYVVGVGLLLVGYLYLRIFGLPI